jgi:hypothetical protein
LNGFTHPPIDRTRLGRADDYLKLPSSAMGDVAAEDLLPECPLSTHCGHSRTALAALNGRKGPAEGDPRRAFFKEPLRFTRLCRNVRILG